MLRVKLLNDYPYWPIQRQTPKEGGKWGDIEFLINDHTRDCDYLVVCGGINKDERIICPKSNTLFLTTEPPNVKTYNSFFLNQFQNVISPDLKIEHKNIVRSQQGLPWMVGAKYKGQQGWSDKFDKNYDELKTMSFFSNKTKMLSVILSKKDISDGHILKNHFVQKLKQHFGDILDVYGVGIDEVEDKWDAIASYRYHLVLENCNLENYWTEKLADCFLAGSFPIYYGCPNINDFFDPESYLKIDISDLNGAISIIENAFKNDLYSKSKEPIMRSRLKVLDQYNLFPMLRKFILENYKFEKPEELLLLQEGRCKSGRISTYINKLQKLKLKLGL